MGTFLKMISQGFMKRPYHPLRLIFDIFDRVAVNTEEREVFSNIESFKEHVHFLIEERRQEMKQPNFNVKDSYDFITKLLTDDLFKDDYHLLMDECMTFIGAATQTSIFMVVNLIYYLMKNPEVKKKVQ